MRYFSWACALLFIVSCDKSEDNSNVNPKPPTTENSDEGNVDEQGQSDNPQNSKLIVNSVLPQFVDLGDTLSLRGENFNKDIRIYLGQRQLKIPFGNDSIVQFELPYSGFEPDSLHLSINSQDTITVLKNAFRLYPPKIDSIPSNFGFRDTVVVYGKHLTNRPDVKDGIIELNGNRITVVDQNKDSIRFVLPYSVDKHDNSLLVRAQLRTLVNDKGVVVPDPIINEISKDSTLVGDRLTIYGANFYPDFTSYNEVLIDEKQTEVLEAYRDSLIIRVPLGPYKGRDIGKVRVNVLDKEIDADVSLHLKSKWYLYGFKRGSEISRSPVVNPISRESFYYNNSMYFNVYDLIDGFENSSNSNYRLYKYTPENNNWEQQADLPVFSNVQRGESIQLFPIVDGRLYIYINREVNNFYEYNLTTQNLIQLEDFPATYGIGDAIGFTTNNNFYVGAGYAKEFGSSSYIINRKFWKYSEALHSWKEITEIPEVPGQHEHAYYSNYFKKDNKVYICNGDKAYETWEFTPDETWVRKSDLKNPISQTVFAQIEDKGYFYHYGDRLFYEYDIVTDNWSRREDLKVEGYDPRRGTMFVHNGFVYLVGYLSGYPPEYNGFTNGDHLIIRTELSNFTNQK